MADACSVTVDFINCGEYLPGSEREAQISLQSKGFFIRPPPKPHELDEDITTEARLFQTIHMGAPVVDANSWKLILDGLVDRPFCINLSQLRQMPCESIISFHECYGSPLTDPTKNLWRIGNVEWTGVPLRDLLTIARPDVVRGSFVWSDGLDSGTFAGISADRYQKDLPIYKALSPEVLVAYEMNGKPLSTDRGGPVRLVVPGWFGTNSTKWLCHLSVQEKRSPSPFTTIFYNETDPADSSGVRQRPVWMVEPNSMIVRPRPEERFFGHGYIEVWGRAWGAEEIVRVDISVDRGHTWIEASVTPRRQFGWQSFRLRVFIHRCGTHIIQARATDRSGVQQPLSKRRNHVPTVQIRIEPKLCTAVETLR